MHYLRMDMIYFHIFADLFCREACGSQKCRISVNSSISSTKMKKKSCICVIMKTALTLAFSALTMFIESVSTEYCNHKPNHRISLEKQPRNLFMQNIIISSVQHPSLIPLPFQVQLQKL